MSEMNEDHPIWQAIDTGGGQTCDIRGVLRSLTAAGYVIVPREPTAAMINRALVVRLKPSPDRDCSTYLYDEEAREIWHDQIDEALK